MLPAVSATVKPNVAGNPDRYAADPGGTALADAVVPASEDPHVPDMTLDRARLDSCDQPAVNAMHPAPWEIRLAPGPVVATAIHAGHDVRPEVARWMSITEEERLRDEDPLTDFWLGVGDTTVRVNRSRFEVDLNRPPERSVARESTNTWGVQVWDQPPPPAIVADGCRMHRSFYEIVGSVMDQLIARWGYVLVLDVHSYNHRRQGPWTTDEPADNPDLDLGATTLDRERFGPLLRRFTEALRCCSVRDRPVEVRENVRFPGGGYFPEWLHQRYPTSACVISLKYKKIFMDEWAATADIVALNALRAGLANAVDVARKELLLCR
jgi:N-formylglutamate deformylase